LAQLRAGEVDARSGDGRRRRRVETSGDGGTVTEAMPNVTRNTRQRAEVLALLREVDGFHTAQQLHRMLVARDARVGLTTVYRTLQLLVDAGEVDSTRLPGGEQLFRRCSLSRHHHHLVCRQCGRAVEVAGPAVEQWADQVAAQHGFTDVGHTLEIFGTCATCAGRPSEGSASEPS
jgi:Fur family ferric uptake transcriptional regulator